MLFIFTILIQIFKSNSLNYPFCSSQNLTILNSLNGKVQGACYNITINYANKSPTTDAVLTWLGVPYAQPPIETMRFKSPRPVESWANVLSGLSLPKQCIQPPFSDQVNSSEDCLYLNIYTPYKSYLKYVSNNNQSDLLPILINMQSSLEYDGLIMSLVSDTIVVTINYRSGVFGFLYINGTEAKGNQALLDQNLAIKWVYANAKSFGGNKNKITISGELASYHLLYRESWSYFNNAIVQSGNPITSSYGTLILKPYQSSLISIKLGNSLGCTGELLGCLQSKSFKLINLISTGFMTFPSFVLDSVVFEGEPKKLFENGHFKRCNILTGSNNYEELSLASIEIGNELINDILYGKMSSLRMALKKRLNLDEFYLDKIINLYVPFNKILDRTINYFYYFIEIITDFQYRCPTYQLADYYSKYNKDAYVYLYGHKLSVNEGPPIDGAGHNEELPIVFGEPLVDNSYTEEERVFSEQIIKFWSSFVNNDKPSMNQWLKFNDKLLTFTRNVIYLKNGSIKNTNIYPDTDEKCKFWSTFYSKF
jgi:carboxylesterase type B